MRAILITLIVFLYTSCTFLEIDQSDIGEPDSSIHVSIEVRRDVGFHGEGHDCLPVFGVLIPNGWELPDSIQYEHPGGFGYLSYSIEYSDSMDMLEPAPPDYEWWVGLDTMTSIIPVGLVTGEFDIFTDDQNGTFMLDYMMGGIAPARIDYFMCEPLHGGRSYDHPVSINAPQNLVVTNPLDSSPGSLRMALNQISVGGTISFALPSPIAIQLDSQLVVDRSVTILGPTDGELTLIAADSSRVILVNAHNDVVISNLIIQGGNVPDESGGGILHRHTESELAGGSLTIRNSTIKENHASEGGGIFSQQSALIVENCKFENNSALFRGGGLMTIQSDLRLDASRVMTNSTSSTGETDGGGVYLLNGNVTINGSLIARNSSSSSGGGIFIYAGVDISITNTTIVNNFVPANYGKNLALSRSSHLSIINSIVGNESNLGVIVPEEEAYFPIIYNSNLIGNMNGVNWSGGNNIQDDPLFSSEEEDDYHLLPNSPCIDAGAIWSQKDSDGTLSDMGAFTQSGAAGTGEFPPGVIGGVVAGEIVTDVSLSSDVIIAEGTTLTIAPGVVVSNIGHPSKIQVFGTLIAMGTASDSIHFVGGMDGWHGIDLMHASSSESQFKYCNISNSITSGIACFGSSPLIENSLISLNLGEGYDGSGGTSMGGGLRFERSSARILNTRISHNSTESNGGGISAREYSNLTLENVIIQSNTGDWGGGISLLDSRLTMENVTLSENESVWAGGGLGSYRSVVSMVDCNILSNSSSDGPGGGLQLGEFSQGVFDKVTVDGNSARNGGGLTLEFAETKFIDCSITGNLATDHGGGIYGYYTSPEFINTTIADNIALANESNGFRLEGWTHPRFVNSIVWGTPDQNLQITGGDSCTVLMAYSDIENGENALILDPENNCTVTWGNGNLNTDPLFANPDSGNYIITSNSPCLNAGTALFVWGGDTLVHLSEDEYVGSAPDMGAVQLGLPSDLDPVPNLPLTFQLYQNYPNPFNPSTTISYSLPVQSNVEIVIYDILGKEVNKLVSEVQQAGSHRISWQGLHRSGKKMSTGLYFYRLNIHEAKSSRLLFTSVRKMILIK